MFWGCQSTLLKLTSKIKLVKLYKLDKFYFVIEKNQLKNNRVKFIGKRVCKLFLVYIGLVIFVSNMTHVMMIFVIYPGKLQQTIFCKVNK